jgi:uncharacterized protein YlxW (UPF0749 family)
VRTPPGSGDPAGVPGPPERPGDSRGGDSAIADPTTVLLTVDSTAAGDSRVAGTTSAGRSGRPARRIRRRTRPIGPDLVAGAVFAIAGALFVAGATSSQDGDLRVDGSSSLRSAITERADANAELADEVAALTARVEALQGQIAPGTGLAATQEQIDALAPVVGLTEMVGPGVSVILDDAQAPRPIPPDMTGDDYLVHQEDVQGVVNALWRGGASGMTVMGQRLISTSAVRCVGNTVILQGRVYSPPFVIEAVGDVAGMQASLDADPAVQFFRELSAEVGLRYEQSSSVEMVLPPYSGPLTTTYAKVTL